ncbi:MAG: family 16 glycosylhydrolase [Janthinobacterium lividum]
MTLIGRASEGWNAVGFMQAPTSKTAGEGYGLFQVSGYANAGQGVGICFVMWPANNVWLDKSHPYAATELDLLESWDKTQSGTSTVHYYSYQAPSNNGQIARSLSVDLTKLHTYALDWERNSTTYYIDGKQIYRDTVHTSLDAADGGVNKSLGAEVVNERALVTTPTVQLHITDMSYSATVSGNSGSASSATLAAAQSGSSQAGSSQADASQVGTSQTPRFIFNSNATVTIASGQALSDSGRLNTLVFPAAGGVTLNATTLSNADSFDLRAVMAQTDWDGKSADLGSYLTHTTTSDGKDMQVLLHPLGGAASLLLATITSAGPNAGAFASFEKQALLS